MHGSGTNNFTDICKICGANISASYIFKEMMFGIRDEFEYHECSDCGCLQIADIPVYIEKYYPDYYYAYKQEIPKLKRQPLLKRVISTIRFKIKYKRAKDELLSYFLPIKTPPHHKILDIGCGRGGLICKLYNKGFRHVRGVDKFISKEKNYGFGVTVMKKDLTEIKNKSYDLLMMHHVLEHMDDPQTELKECFRILKNNRYLIVRIPVKTFAWTKYKTNWVQLDAPRHFFIHTSKSMNLLADNSGFKIKEVIFDSGAFQFWGSELYKKDIPLYMPNTGDLYSIKEIFDDKTMKSYEERASKLNRSGEGDQAIFYLYKS